MKSSRGAFMSGRFILGNLFFLIAFVLLVASCSSPSRAGQHADGMYLRAKRLVGKDTQNADAESLVKRLIQDKMIGVGKVYSDSSAVVIHVYPRKNDWEKVAAMAQRNGFALTAESILDEMTLVYQEYAMIE